MPHWSPVRVPIMTIRRGSPRVNRAALQAAKLLSYLWNNFMQGPFHGQATHAPEAEPCIEADQIVFFPKHDASV